MIQRVRTNDGLELHGLIYKGPKTQSVVLHCHGMAGNFYENRFVDIVGTRLVSEGIDFCAMNNRGHDFIADFIVEKSDKLEYARIGQVYERIEDSIKDIAAWVDHLKDQGYTRIILMGHSLGAVKAVLYAHVHQAKLSGLILASPPDMMGLAKKERDFAKKMEQAVLLVKSSKEKQLIDGQVFDNYPISAGSFVNFFSEGSKTDMFPIKEGKVSQELRSITLPMTVVFGEKDHCFDYDPTEIISFFKKHVPHAKLTVIPTADHVYLGAEKCLAQELCDFAKRL